MSTYQDHANQNIYNRALKMLTTYFNAEDEMDSSVAPTVQGQQYGFGTGPSGQNPGAPGAAAPFSF